MVHAAVCKALRQALGPVAGRLGVRVHDGVVTLTGTVESAGQKHSAEQAVGQVVGVRAVAEELQINNVSPVPHDDLALATAVADSLAVEGVPVGRHINVQVEAGWVTLTGEVASAADYSAIDRALECVAGVRGVNSEVRVAPPVTSASSKGPIPRSA
jgi:osmotically-inducible protein OsmY